MHNGLLFDKVRNTEKMSTRFVCVGGGGGRSQQPAAD